MSRPTEMTPGEIEAYMLGAECERAECEQIASDVVTVWQSVARGDGMRNDGLVLAAAEEILDKIKKRAER